MPISNIVRQPKTIFSPVQWPKQPGPLSHLSLKALIDITFDSEPGIALAVASGVPTQSPAAARDTLLDTYFDCLGYDAYGNPDQGVGKAWAIASHDTQGIDFNANAIAYANAYGEALVGNVIVAAIAIAYASAFGDVYLIPKKDSWVKWSRIGYLDFTIDKSNEAGERPVDWKGFVWQVKKLGNKVIAYGQNGVTALIPSGLNVGMETIYRIGLKGKNAVAGTDNMHFFVDNLGQLWKLSDSLQMLDYSEYLTSATTNISLFYDKANDMLYLCDGIVGYIYNDKSQSLGSGPINVSGIDTQTGLVYITAPAAIVTPTFEICTDIYDFGTRKGKSIISLECGVDMVNILQASIDYRNSKALSFSTTSWYNVDSKGMCYISQYGKEFRFKFKSTVWEYFELDYINVNMVIHGH